jgi:SAM-dependent methyltransferase
MRSIADVDITDYDFFDFGSGHGNSIRRCEELFGGRGLGIDVDRKKIDSAQNRGVEVVYGDIMTLPRRKLVTYVCMDNFLEHLPNSDVLRQMLEVAVAVATDFLYIRHPSFEDEAYLAELGLKQYWHDWTGHPSHVLLSDFCAMLKQLKARPFDVEFASPIFDSSDPSMLPFSAPPDQHDYDERLHGPKPMLTFGKPVYRQIRITAHLNLRAIMPGSPEHRIGQGEA